MKSRDNYSEQYKLKTGTEIGATEAFLLSTTHRY